MFSCVTLVSLAIWWRMRKLVILVSFLLTCVCRIFRIALTLSDFCTYITCTKFQNRCDSCTYTYVHGLFYQNMGL